MKSLTKYISHMKDLHSLNEYLTEKLVINQRFNEKLIINKDYKNLSDEFCDEFEDDIEYVLTQTVATMNNDIKNVLVETFYKRNKRLAVLDIIKEENLFNSKNKIFVVKGYVDVNSFYYDLFLQMSAYCKDHINDRWLCYYNHNGHDSIYVLNTYKYYIIICGDDLQDKRFSSSNIIIQKK